MTEHKEGEQQREEQVDQSEGVCMCVKEEEEEEEEVGGQTAVIIQL